MTSSEVSAARAATPDGNGCSRLGAVFRSLMDNLFGRPSVSAGQAEPVHKRVPEAVARRMVALRQIIRAGGRGSDMAAAELQGMVHTLMWLGFR